MRNLGRVIPIWVFALIVPPTVLMAPAAAPAETVQTIAVCWSNGKQTDCTAKADPNKARSYCRQQCQFWASNRAQKRACHEVWSCSEIGLAGVVYHLGGDRVVGFCGLSSEAELRQKMSAACGRSCLKYDWKLGSLETAFKEVELKTINAALTEARKNVKRNVLALMAAQLPLPSAFPRQLAKYVYSLATLNSRIRRLEQELDVTKGARTELALEIEGLREDEQQVDRDFAALERENLEIGKTIRKARQSHGNTARALTKEESEWFDELLRRVRAAHPQ